MKKSVVVIIAFVAILLFAVGGFYLWSRYEKGAYLPVGLREISRSLFENQKKSKEVSGRTSCASNSEEGWCSYENGELGLAFQYPESWGDPNIRFFSSDEYTSGTRYIIRFYPEQSMSTPTLYVESNDFDLHAPGDAWGLSASDIDLNKTDKELVKELSFPWTTSISVQRKRLFNSDGLVVEEEGEDPLDNTKYHVLYYLFPKYNAERSWNLMMRIDALDKQETENWLKTVRLY